MAYIGTSPSNGVRRIHTYTATAGQEIFTGSSTEGVTLTYADTNYIDVFQNGVLLGSADYTSTSGTSVVLAQGASVSDLVVIVVYDVFSVADTVSKTNGGSFDSAVTMSSTLAVTGASTLTGALSAKGGAVFNEDSADVDFRVESNNSANMFFIDGGNDRIKINTDQTVSTATAETFAVDAGASGGYGGVFSSNTSGGYSAIFLKAETNVSNLAIFAKNSSTVGSISTNGSTTSFNTSSDHRLKENVDYTFDATTRLKQLKPARFNFIADADTTVDGFLAHEVQSVVPEAITGTHNEVDDDGNAVMQGIDQSKLVPLLVKTIQELEARITALENGE